MFLIAWTALAFSSAIQSSPAWPKGNGRPKVAGTTAGPSIEWFEAGGKRVAMCVTVMGLP